MCRCFIRDPVFVQIYKASYFNINFTDDNAMDKLEDLWVSNEYKLPTFCSNGYDHYLGMLKGCFCFVVNIIEKHVNLLFYN